MGCIDCHWPFLHGRRCADALPARCLVRTSLGHAPHHGGPEQASRTILEPGTRQSAGAAHCLPTDSWWAAAWLQQAGTSSREERYSIVRTFFPSACLARRLVLIWYIFLAGRLCSRWCQLSSQHPSVQGGHPASVLQMDKIRHIRPQHYGTTGHRSVLMLRKATSRKVL